MSAGTSVWSQDPIYEPVRSLIVVTVLRVPSDSSLRHRSSRLLVIELVIIMDCVTPNTSHAGRSASG